MTIESCYLDHPHPIPFAHRGGAIDAPENSKAAFAAALDLGFRYLETDVHLTSDGMITAFHDDELDRVTDGSGTVAELTWSEVSKARIDGREPIPLMEDLLQSWPTARWNIDAKHDDVVEPLVELIKRTDAAERVCLASFSDRRIDQMRALLPGVVTNVGARGTGHLRANASRLATKPSLSGECVQVPPNFRGVPLVTQRFVDRVHELGGVVHVWTIDDEREMHRLLDLGVDGIMTDRPKVLRAVFMERGIWSG